jgi:predicted porin
MRALFGLKHSSLPTLLWPSGDPWLSDVVALMQRKNIIASVFFAMAVFVWCNSDNFRKEVGPGILILEPYVQLWRNSQMKKSLIALAALAVVSAASAQSSVTISGNLDFAASSSSGSAAITNGQTIATSTGVSSTSVIRFIAVEDLGGGLKATAQYNFDPRTLSNDSGAVTNNTASNGSTTAGNSLGATFTGLQRDEIFIGLSGDFGNVRLGSPNSIGLGAHGDSSPLGTGIGAGYTANGKAATMTNSYVQTRYNRSARYDSPTISGFTASALYAPGGDEVAVANTTPASLAGGTNAALTIPNARQATEFGLAYANGPLKVSYAYVAQAAQANGTGWYGTTGAGTTTLSTSKTNVSMINANYNLGATTLYAGWNKGDALTATAALAPTATKGYRLAVKHTIGAFDLIGQYTTQDSTTAANVVAKAKVTGLRADYNLSKTTAVYVGYENHDSGASSANIHKVVATGLRKSF